MKKIIVFMAVVSLLFTSCGKADTGTFESSVSGLNEQTVEQLRVIETNEKKETDYVPVNYDTQLAMWITYMNYKNILYGKSKEEFTDSIKDELKNISDTGFNTVYVHASAFNDCYYKSSVYPKGQYYSTKDDFDPLEIIINEAHELEISVHAWINPLRCQTDDEIKKIDGSYKIKSWYDDSSTKGKYLVNVKDRWYLNPAYEEVRDYISGCVSEIAENYNVDGIHIDDYFYPVTDSDFDTAAFKESGESDLEEWRIGNINLMVSSMYSALKSVNEDMLFGISPQGNIEADYNMYADVGKWASESGFCDYIVPQLYYGYKNESCPFTETAERWKSLVTSDGVKLIAGICTYKIGTEDKWAGAGKNEWKDTKGIPANQTATVFEKDIADGIAVYSYESTFDNNIDEEISKLSKSIKAYSEGKQ